MHRWIPAFDRIVRFTSNPNRILLHTQQKLFDTTRGIITITPGRKAPIIARAKFVATLDAFPLYSVLSHKGVSARFRYLQSMLCLQFLLEISKGVTDLGLDFQFLRLKETT